jgi:hypothetical protein
LRKKLEKFSEYYRMQYYFCFCNDVSGLMEESGFPHDVNEWKLYRNAYGQAQRLKLKSVLLYNGNLKSSILDAHSVT